MNPLLEAAREVCDFLASRRWDYCIIGGLAVQQWGEPRTTMDADLTLLTDFGEEETYVGAILKRFESRIPNGMDFALRHRVVLIRASNGKDVDISLGALPFEVEMIQRATRVEFAPGFSLPCCTAEDLFVMKAFAGRPRDWSDAEGIVARHPQLDQRRVVNQLTILCELKEAPEIVERARRLLLEAK